MAQGLRLKLGGLRTARHVAGGFGDKIGIGIGMEEGRVGEGRGGK